MISQHFLRLKCQVSASEKPQGDKNFCSTPEKSQQKQIFVLIPTNFDGEKKIISFKVV